ncbi:MAG: hypothetical protein K6G81_13065 [Lachnospiraceae bacterium]|nr:hypothetical protein [Lachnospiraceae bacterium]
MICTGTAVKRANSIEKYGVNREFLAGTNTDNPRYDILNAVIINIGKFHDSSITDNELISMLTDLLDERMNGAEKIKKLKTRHSLKTTREIESEVNSMCTYAEAIERKAFENGLEALVNILKKYITDFDSLYQEVISTKVYKDVTAGKL